MLASCIESTDISIVLHIKIQHSIKKCPSANTHEAQTKAPTKKEEKTPQKGPSTQSLQRCYLYF